jgi:hypothetical protein
VITAWTCPQCDKVYKRGRSSNAARKHRESCPGGVSFLITLVKAKYYHVSNAFIDYVTAAGQQEGGATSAVAAVVVESDSKAVQKDCDGSSRGGSFRVHVKTKCYHHMSTAFDH